MFELQDLLDNEKERRRLDAGRARILADLETQQICDLEHGMRTGAWWAREAGVRAAECLRTAKISVQLASTFTVLLDAVERGRISWDHARFICVVSNARIVDSMVELQPAFVELASHMIFPRWEQEVRSIADQLDREGGHNPDLDRSSHAHLAATLGGAALKGWFSDDLSIPMQDAIEAKTDQLFHRHKANREACPELEMPSRSELRAMAIAELVALGVGANWKTTKPNRPECTLLLRPETDTVTTMDGAVLSDTARTLLLNDPLWRFLRFDRHGSILDYGRTERLAPDDLRAALAVRDGGCVFPGCDHPTNHCDAHHVQHWNRDGTTDTHNMVLLCRFHHGVTHRNGWAMTPTDHQWFQWTTPSGFVIESHRNHQARPGHTRPDPREQQPSGA